MTQRSSFPIISVCIPAYRADRFLLEALESVRAQTFTDWEIIVTEDGSKDHAEDIVRSFAKTVSQPVKYTRHEVNKGLPATRNTGISLANGEFVALLDSDDYWKADHLETLMGAQQVGNAGLVHSGSILFDSDSGKILEHRRPTPVQLERFPVSLYAEGYIIQPSSVMLKRSALGEIGNYDEAFRHCEDLELWFRAAKNNVTFQFSGHDTCYYRKHGMALSAQGGPMSAAAARAYVKHFDWKQLPLPLRREKTSSQLEAAGRIHLRSEPGRAWGFFREAWKIRRHPKYPIFATIASLVALFRRERLKPFAV